MGAISDAFKRPSAYGAKKTSLYEDVKDRIDGVILRAQLTEVEEWLDSIDHTLPTGWRDAFDNMLELKREELEAEDIGNILRDRFDF
jgi:hypothetical protein